MSFFDFLTKKRKHEKVALEKSASPKNESQKAKVSSAPAKKTTISKRGAVTSQVLYLQKPHLTERSRELGQQGRYVFRVLPHTTKSIAKQAIEHLYGVIVRDVRMVHIPPKPRRRGLTKGTKKGYKKAIITLREGERIDIS